MLRWKNINTNGNTESLKTSVLDEIEKLYYIYISINEFVTQELVFKMAELTGKINREISVYINRKGNVIDVSVGDSNTVELPKVEGR